MHSKFEASPAVLCVCIVQKLYIPAEARAFTVQNIYLDYVSTTPTFTYSIMYELVMNITSSMVVEICGVISKYVKFVDPNLIKNWYLH